jgi:hypothetical protein
LRFNHITFLTDNHTISPEASWSLRWYEPGPVVQSVFGIFGERDDHPDEPYHDNENNHWQMQRTEESASVVSLCIQRPHAYGVHLDIYQVETPAISKTGTISFQDTIHFSPRVVVIPTNCGIFELLWSQVNLQGSTYDALLAYAGNQGLCES